MSTQLDKLKLKRDNLKAILNKPDPISQSFYGGRVGFKKGSAKRKWEKAIDRELSLHRELAELEEKIERLENPVKRSKSQEQSPKEWNVGDKAIDCYNTEVTVIKINIKSVTIEYSGGFKETIKPHLLTKIKNLK